MLSLESVTIPNTAVEIKDRAFRGCTSLADLTIGNGVTSIEEVEGMGAFQDIVIAGEDETFAQDTDGFFFVFTVEVEEHIGISFFCETYSNV